MSFTDPEHSLQTAAFSSFVDNISYSFSFLLLMLSKYLVNISAIQPLTFISKSLQSNHYDISIVVASKYVFVRVDDLLGKTVTNLV